MTKIFKTTIRTFIVALILVVSACCEKPTPSIDYSKSRNVLLLYSAGYNSLRDYLQDDINDLKQGWLPEEEDGNEMLLIYTHSPIARGQYSTPTNPYLIKLYRGKDGKAVADTIVRYPEGTVSASADQLNAVIGHIKSSFPAKSYGMIFSSHATGYLPPDYYLNPEAEVKSIGQDYVNDSGNYISYEIELKDFANAIPMKMDYILFDACLMGGAEVAYELRGKCSKVGFSQTEVLAEGLNYKTLAERLLKNAEPDPQAVCEDFIAQYDSMTGAYKSATVSFIDCDRMDNLASVCRDIFAARRDGLANIDPAKVQRFYRLDKHWFYDLESIIIEAGATENELADLHSALEECVLYKGHTPEFMSEFDIDIFSGFSMYLPCNGGPELDKYYKTLSWNKATGLVE